MNFNSWNFRINFQLFRCFISDKKKTFYSLPPKNSKENRQKFDEN